MPWRAPQASWARHRAAGSSASVEAPASRSNCRCSPLPLRRKSPRCSLMGFLLPSSSSSWRTSSCAAWSSCLLPCCCLLQSAVSPRPLPFLILTSSLLLSASCSSSPPFEPRPSARLGPAAGHWGPWGPSSCVSSSASPVDPRHLPSLLNPLSLLPPGPTLFAAEVPRTSSSLYPLPSGPPPLPLRRMGSTPRCRVSRWAPLQWAWLSLWGPPSETAACHGVLLLQQAALRWEGPFSLSFCLQLAFDLLPFCRYQVVSLHRQLLLHRPSCLHPCHAARACPMLWGRVPRRPPAENTLHELHAPPRTRPPKCTAPASTNGGGDSAGSATCSAFFQPPRCRTQHIGPSAPCFRLAPWNTLSPNRPQLRQSPNVQEHAE